jgi:hypothetical protein
MHKIKVNPISISKIDAIPNNWSNEDFKGLLDLFGVDPGNMTPDEVKEYCLMAIADNELPESASMILKYLIGDLLNDGQYQNLAHGMADDKMWEEFPEIGLHKYIFAANQLMYKAYNGKVPKGEAIKLTLEIVSDDEEINELLNELNPDLLMRLVIGGTDEHSILRRLYNDLMDAYLEDAEGILWDINKSGNKYEIVSSSYWFDDFIAQESYDVELSDLSIYSNEEEE